MAVPYSFSNYPPGSTIPLGQLDANFSYLSNQIAGGGGDVVAVVQGGTGATSPQGALLNLLPNQSQNAGKFLTTDGNGVISWAAAGATAAGVTSFSGGVTGLSPVVATTGAITLGGTLALANGGTGANTQAGAANAILPSQSGNPGKFLVTDGTNVSWGAGIPGSGTVTSVSLSGGTTGLSAIGNPITTSGTLTLTGTLAVPNGGTGISSTPSSGQILIGNGSNYTLNTLTAGANITITNGPGTITIDATGSAGGVTDISFGTTGLTPSSATPGSVLVAGTLNIANGGTGQTSAPAALGALLPSQVGNNGKYLATDGFGVVSWQAPSGVALGNYGALTVNSTTPAPGAWTINGGNTITGNGNLTLPDSGIASQGVLTAATVNLVNTLSPGGHIVTNGSIIDFTCAVNKLTYSINYSSASQTDINYYASGTLLAYHSFNTAATIGLYGQTFGNWLYQFNAAGELTVNAANTFKPGGGVWQVVSDRRVKKNVEDYKTSDIDVLKPVTYEYNGEHGTIADGKRYHGFIAQDLLDTPFSGMVSERDGIYHVDSNELIYALLNQVKELKLRVAALEAKG
jgi:hypothetical protein